MHVTNIECRRFVFDLLPPFEESLLKLIRIQIQDGKYPILMRFLEDSITSYFVSS
jgi:hypothetical protein